ncbi:pyridoxamine 5'-phosphate oxidase family protein [Halalkalibacterium halodurans]|uniref:BH2630 protein n=2 Tax=Halalkalibacterium halodurans TaxID=86665 RepID=Q9K9L5_HALH5|nr:pyridoxamine 5'-phosphate oxidase family protein [Halalkalibacterium halodurans]MDY7223164.1 pyridoxamine 5'-phosphate oxidase family protein [Halalkalibacterium halodurans]MDY7242385.1 pyridoxamine 5'-phosphate oxidase family protein [Halalkalibacterium halodurans]MED3647729.1 pyridoxamine 5'-phosphate oxidase family protein [Halalkalibacterium halodurans]MED4079772.1 pyridoxamine 5'-phosphate oxidase family protein [Halalkalibacterium halodurans]MED4086286.1 pyridoxamine 5'-phosphate oxid
MANRVERCLTDELLPLLKGERFVTLSTVDWETGAPIVRAISWVFAPANDRVRMAVDNRSRIVANVKKTPAVTLLLVGNGSAYSISGHATIVEESLDNVPLKLALIEMNIHEVRDVMFYGAKIVSEPMYDKTYDEEAAAKLDGQVMAALQQA